MSKDAMAAQGPLDRGVRPRFCGDCKHCGSMWDNRPTSRVCAAVPARREAHFLEHGDTPDAHFTAPLAWVYANSGMAERCLWFEWPNAK